MDVGTVLSVAQTMFAALQCLELRELCSILGYQSELDNLAETVTTVKAVFQDAEAKQELSHEAQLYIERLKDAVYDADDLLDEFVTLAELKYKKFKQSGKVSEKVFRFFSGFKDLGIARSMSLRVKEMRGKLDAIADNHKMFSFNLDFQPIRKRREETCSYVYAQDIIGRDGDKKKIVDMLLDPNVRRDVSFLTIVGMGGLGKTTLAQLVYNDVRIKNEFPVRLWACVADEDPKHLDVKAVVCKILGSASSHKHEESTLDWLQGRLQERLVEKKYLLVLDDVWNENRHDWLKLEGFLKGGLTGSWVVVTTRSRETARIIGDGSLYDLKGLSDKDSWNLFERVAFGQEKGQANPPDLVEIGRMVVKKCVAVPLAIRVAGSLLYGHGKDKWLSFQMNGLASVGAEENGILPILKFSYHYLNTPLKSCFSYCALFPKDYKIEKEMLINLWIAQGYVVPLDIGQSIEDTAEEYFLILLRRCFFQDVEKDEYGEIRSCKMHDLMHEVAQEVARKEICAVDSITSDLDRRIRHLAVLESIGTEKFSRKNVMRTLLYLCHRKKGLPVGSLLGNWTSLRTLDLSKSRIKSLPDLIGKLIHLRYLDLSENKDVKELPKSFTRLHNLETLILSGCQELMKLPNDFGKLVKLRFLDTRNCESLTQMPLGMGKLSCLHKLTLFSVDLSNPAYEVELEGLKALTKLKDDLEIRILGSEKAAYVKDSTSDGRYLMNKQHLKDIMIRFKIKGSGGASGYQESLMEEMQPHSNLKSLTLVDYNGTSMPSWGRKDSLASSLPNLVEIKLYGCDMFQYFSGLGNLRHLRSLTLSSLMNLEFVEENRYRRDVGAWEASGSSRGAVEESLIFPSLIELELLDLPRLKGWWGGEDPDSRRFPPFPHLNRLEIERCQELRSIPFTPGVVMDFVILNKRLEVRVKGASGRMVIDNMRFLNSSVIPLEALQRLTNMRICYDDELERLEEVGEVLRNSCLSSLRILRICRCSKLISVFKGGLEHLTALEVLAITDCPNLTLNCYEENEDEDDIGKCWWPLQKSLCFLALGNLPKLVNLPKGMQHLTSLRSLEIVGCEAVKTLPDWMRHLTSLTRLEIYGCSEALTQRCQKPLGEDWLNIQHITYCFVTKQMWM